MLVHDFDDEKTLEEEEALSGDSCSNELDDLEKVRMKAIHEFRIMILCVSPRHCLFFLPHSGPCDMSENILQDYVKHQSN